jgi:hypothetical protein
VCLIRVAVTILFPSPPPKKSVFFRGEVEVVWHSSTYTCREGGARYEEGVIV